MDYTSGPNNSVIEIFPALPFASTSASWMIFCTAGRTCLLCCLNFSKSSCPSKPCEIRSASICSENSPPAYRMGLTRMPSSCRTHSASLLKPNASKYFCGIVSCRFTETLRLYYAMSALTRALHCIRMKKDERDLVAKWNVRFRAINYKICLY